MRTVVSLTELGWTAERQQQLEALGDPTLFAARIAVQHRGAYELLGAEVETAQLSGRFRKGESGDWAAVGDWVAVQRSGDMGVIQHVLPRTTMLARRRPGLQEAQVVAANVDVAFVVTAVGADFSPRRIERYLAAVWASGARPVIVVNKADLAEDLVAIEREAAAVSGGAAFLATSAATGTGMDELRREIPAGGTVVLVGSSGVGKSTLFNRLLGVEQQATGDVRLKDDKGRHTTTRRELLQLPGVGWAIDTPGMREFGIWEASEGLDDTFDEITALAARCRFRDCAHGDEPGCAVRAALEDGTLPAERWDSFEKLRGEEAFQRRLGDARAMTDEKNRWKTIHRGLRARTKVDPKLRDE
jgi:ribosome biogenesis GTPase